MTVDELIERAKRRLNAGQPQPHVWPDSEIDIGACVTDALRQLSERVMRDSELRAWLQQDYAVNLGANGESTDLLTATGSVTGQVGEIILEGMDFGLVRDAENNVLVPLMHYADFVRPQPTVYGYYLKKNRVVATRAKGVAVNSPADILSVLGPITITASFTPKNVSDVPLDLEDDLVGDLCDVVTRKIVNADAA